MKVLLGLLFIISVNAFGKDLYCSDGDRVSNKTIQIQDLGEGKFFVEYDLFEHFGDYGHKKGKLLGFKKEKNLEGSLYSWNQTDEFEMISNEGLKTKMTIHVVKESVSSRVPDCWEYRAPPAHCVNKPTLTKTIVILENEELFESLDCK